MAGYQQLVRGEVLRGKFRNSLERPEPFLPGQPTEIRFRLNDVFHTFLKGHRIMVQVQSSWFPLVDRNPQVFTDIYQAGPEAFRAAEERLYRGPRLASHLVLPVLP
jgi:predicted acyl esterase